MSEVQDNSNVKRRVEYLPSTFSLHKFNSVHCDQKIIYQVLQMTDSLLIFINDKENMQLSNMFLSLPNRYDNLPVGSRLFGDFMEETSKNIALRLSKKLNKTVYVSCNIDADAILLASIEKRIYDEIKEKPGMF